ncbi:MAG: helix-turn-helix domain-containing protein [Lachnospiraceae bacterium]|jgi:transcriptional regulator with XRE-family HTH domain
MKFGKTLYELRKQAGLSQKELANLLDVAQASINYWEKGQRIPSLEAAKNISTFFNISLDKLTDDMASDIIESAESEPISPEIERLQFFADYLKEMGCNIIVNSKTILGNKETLYTLTYNGKSILLDYDKLIKLSNDTQDYIKFKIEQLFK